MSQIPTTLETFNNLDTSNEIIKLEDDTDVAEVLNSLTPEAMDVDLLQVQMNAESALKTANDSTQETLKDDVIIVESHTTENYLFKCVFCDRILSTIDQPQLLECLHNACGICVSNKLDEQPDNKVLNCASCNMLSNAMNIIDNKFLLEASDENTTAKTSETKCSSCNDDAIAVSYCVDCSEYICESCVQAHQRLKITKDHTIRAKESGANEVPNELHCTIHPNEKLALFCENCDQLTCRDCQLIEHRDHKYKFTHEMVVEARKSISSMLNDVAYKRVLLNSAMKVIANRQNLISDKRQELVKEVTQLIVKLTQTINTRGKQIVANLNDVCEQKMKTLQEKKVALDELSKITDHCIEFTQHALDSSNNMALLFSKRQLTNHLHMIKRRRADIPNPEIPLRITLNLDKIPDLIKVLASVGHIVVDGRIYPGQIPSQTSSSPTPNPNPAHSPQLTLPMSVTPPSFSQSRLPPPYPFPPRVTNMSQGNGNHSQAPMLQQTDQNIQRLTVRPLMENLVGINRSVNNQQQQVSSSTHPQGLMHERNLRGLLQSNGNAVYVQTGPNQYQAVQPQFAQQYQTRFQNYQVQVRPTEPRNMAPPMRLRVPIKAQSHSHALQLLQQQQQQHLQQTTTTVAAGARWHIPQQNEGAGSSRAQLLPGFVDNYKITLKPVGTDGKPSGVSSTIPKTPSPTLPAGKSETEQSFDKVCQDSVNDLMATIAKLDSNGVQVLAEGGRSKTGGSPHVDSSTDGVTNPSTQVKTDVEIGKDDPNEDWCAVCMDGGELVCCDKCPKVFHQFCHIPNLSVEESDTWQCLLCVNFTDIPDNPDEERNSGELTIKEKKICERLVLELYCQYEPSLPFREIIGVEHTDYHSIIKNPIALDTIRHRLEWNSENHYTSIQQLVQDIQIMFKNAYTFNEAGSQVYNDAKKLEKFFIEQMEKLIPYISYETDEGPPNKKYKKGNT